MKKWQRKCINSALILLFIAPLFGLFTTTLTSSLLSTPLASGRISAAYTVTTTSEINALSNTDLLDGLIIDPSVDVTGAIISNFNLTGGYQILVQNTTPNVQLQFSIINSILNTNMADGFSIKGSPSITATNLFIAGPLQSNSYPAQIGTVSLTLNNVTASKMRFHVSGGTFVCNNSKITSLVLKGFTTAVLGSANITTGLWVEGAGIVYIFNTPINGTIHESVIPTISCPIHYSVPYSFVFQPQVQVELALGGSDNIRGPAYGLSYSLDIYKNGVLQLSVPNHVGNSYPLTIDTAASYEVRFTCHDTQGNVSTETIISIIPQADLLWFILMIVIIAGAAVGAILIFSMWKQRQWQKTALVEIPA